MLNLDSKIVINGVETTPDNWMKLHAREDQFMQNLDTLEEHGDVACDEEWLNMFHDHVANHNLTYEIIEDGN